MLRLACFGLLSLSSLLAQHHADFKISADYVRVPVTAFDSQGRLMQDLTRDDFRLLDEGANRNIENFVLDQAPVHVLLMLDSSGSLKEELQEIRFAAIRFASSFGPEDRIAIMSFADEVVLLQDWTHKQKAIRKSLRKLKRGYRTALYDALQEGIGDRFRGVPGRKVIILLTDGLDNESRSHYANLAPQLIREGITLYIVSRTRLVHPQVRDSTRVEFLNRVMKNLLRDEGDFVAIYFREKETAMRRLADLTGGRVFFPEQLEELGSSYLEVARELKQQYVLTFRPPSDSSKGLRQIEVLCLRPVGRLHYRKQYSWLGAPRGE